MNSPSARSAPSFDPLLGSGGLPLEQDQPRKTKAPWSNDFGHQPQNSQSQGKYSVLSRGGDTEDCRGEILELSEQAADEMLATYFGTMGQSNV